MTKAAHPDHLLLALGAALDLALASETALLAIMPEMPDGAIDGEVTDAVCGPVNAISRMIEAIEPTTQAGVALRCKVWARYQGFHEIADARNVQAFLEAVA